MKIGIIKPDYKIHGGFEVVVDILINEMIKANHEVTLVKIDATNPKLDSIPCMVENKFNNENPEFFKYINDFWRYLRLDVKDFDVVISTQPPSFAIDHPKHIALFYHHMKIYYDLSEVYTQAKLNRPTHYIAQSIIREIDSLRLKKVTKILAGSKTIKKRLAKYNELEENVDIIYAGIDTEIYNYNQDIQYISPLVVGRHEFPKRPELFVAAMKDIPSVEGRVVGEGGRTQDLKKIDRILTHVSHMNVKIESEILWKEMSNGNFSDIHEQYYKKGRKLSSNINFIGRVSKEELLKEYAKSLCVVCPAYEEDYGLTAIEAMAFKKPVIVCKDGGGLAELVQDGKTGFVVEPTAEAISEAIRYFVENPDKAIEMGKNAYEYSRIFTWQNTTKTLLDVIEGM